MSINLSTKKEKSIRKEVVAELRNEFFLISLKLTLALSAIAAPPLLYSYRIPGIDSPRPPLESRYPDVSQRISAFKEIALHPAKVFPKQIPEVPEHPHHPFSAHIWLLQCLSAFFFVLLIYSYLTNWVITLLFIFFGGAIVLYLEADCRLFPGRTK